MTKGCKMCQASLGEERMRRVKSEIILIGYPAVQTTMQLVIQVQYNVDKMDSLPVRKNQGEDCGMNTQRILCKLKISNGYEESVWRCTVEEEQRETDIVGR